MISNKERVRAYMHLHGLEDMGDFDPEITDMRGPLSEVPEVTCEEIWLNILALDPDAEDMVVEE